MTKEPALYLAAVENQLARLLSMQDREAVSRTYGCFDRTYWCWKFTDFAGARFQEGVYSLAHLWSEPFDGNILYQQDRGLEWIRAGLNFWQTLQYPDGSFDEAYPFEHSLAATAFSSYYVSEALLLAGENLPAAEQASARQSLAAAGNWLTGNDEQHGVLSNHLAAAAAALYLIYTITGEARFEKRCRHFLQRIYDHQSTEGWFEEY